ncbi:hypothetical protein BC827DRAFT_745658 [Russula dissimulans]|nr:hypothetical protein BC827DRAFT_745658 [Russula dissimulans]
MVRMSTHTRHRHRPFLPTRSSAPLRNRDGRGVTSRTHAQSSAHNPKASAGMAPTPPSEARSVEVCVSSLMGPRYPTGEMFCGALSRSCGEQRAERVVSKSLCWLLCAFPASPLAWERSSTRMRGTKLPPLRNCMQLSYRCTRERPLQV